MTTKAVGIDIGGTGIKGAIVDVATGELLTDRKKLATPSGGKPEDILDTVLALFEELGDIGSDTPVGVCFPAVIIRGRTMSAANVSKKWIGLEAEKMFEDKLGRSIHFVNDADAAGVAEARYGAAVDAKGLTILTTLGTGIGSAMLYNGELIPNSELGHLQLDGRDAEKLASTSAKEDEDLSWMEWAKRLQRYYEHLELLFSPDLILVGGGISKSSDEFLPLLDLRAPIKPAKLRNNAGIVGAAELATR
ncbi:MAG: ROK family protein [Micrococcales bacterium]|nr:ROK family protein [Micrococcales bacterium]